MSVDFLEIRDFIITFTQKGIYLDPKNINKLKLKRNNVVKVSLLINDQLTSECYTISYSKTFSPDNQRGIIHYCFPQIFQCEDS